MDPSRIRGRGGNKDRGPKSPDSLEELTGRPRAQRESSRSSVKRCPQTGYLEQGNRASAAWWKRTLL